jgi:hypothetical protein
VWAGSGIAAVVGATTTAYVAGALQAVLPGPSDTICRYVEAPLLEHPLPDDLPGLLVGTFVGDGGRKAADNVAVELRTRTRLPVARTCIAIANTAGVDASDASVESALRAARSVSRARGAEIVVTGQMLQSGAVELSVTHTSEFEEARSTRVRGRVTLSSNPAESETTVDEFIDDQLLRQIKNWANLTALRISPNEDSGALEASVKLSSALARYDPEDGWEALDKQREYFVYQAFAANFAVARWYERCEPAEEAESFARQLAHYQSDIGVLLSEMQAYVLCRSATPRSWSEATGVLWPYVTKLSAADIGDLERIVDSLPWPVLDLPMSTEHANALFARSLLRAAEGSANTNDKTLAKAAGLNLIRADVLRLRQSGIPTAKERQQFAVCRKEWEFSLDSVDAWKTLVQHGVDPDEFIAAARRQDGLTYCWSAAS